MGCPAHCRRPRRPAGPQGQPHGCSFHLGEAATDIITVGGALAELTVRLRNIWTATHLDQLNNQVFLNCEFRSKATFTANAIRAPGASRQCTDTVRVPAARFKRRAPLGSLGATCFGWGSYLACQKFCKNFAMRSLVSRVPISELL